VFSPLKSRRIYAFCMEEEALGGFELRWNDITKMDLKGMEL
jgi:hypothetical protein